MSGPPEGTTEGPSQLGSDEGRTDRLEDGSAAPEPTALPPEPPAPVGWAAYLPSAEPGPRFALRQSPGPVPSLRGVVLGTFELLRSADRDLRVGSIHIVWQAWLVGLSLVLAVWSLTVVHGPRLFDLSGEGRAVTVLPDREVGWLVFIGTIALLGLVALSLEAQLLAALTLAGRQMGTPLPLRPAIELSRRRFWPLVRASAAVFIFASLPAGAVSGVIASGLGAERILVAQTIQLVTGFLIGAPFTYTAVACAVGGFGAVDAIRVSFRLAASRWRLAFAVAILSYLAQLLVELAAGSGLDLVAGLVAATHPNVPSGAAGPLLGLALAALLLVVVGALLFAVNVAAVAPQVVAYAALADLPTEGPEADLAAGLQGTRRISRPMMAGIGLGFVAALAPTWSAIQALLRG